MFMPHPILGCHRCVGMDLSNTALLPLCATQASPCCQVNAVGVGGGSGSVCVLNVVTKHFAMLLVCGLVGWMDGWLVGWLH